MAFTERRNNDDFDLLGLFVSAAVLHVIDEAEAGVEAHGCFEFASPQPMGLEIAAGVLVANDQTHTRNVRQGMRASTVPGD